MDNGQRGDQKRNITILWMDDQPGVVQLYAHFLELVLGVTVDFASTGEIAVRKAERKQYDVIVADIHVPGMTGFELTSHLRQVGIKAPIILTSVSVYRDYQVRTYGADAFLLKPFSFDELVATLEEVLRQDRTHPDPSQRGQLRAQTISEDGGAEWLRQWDERIRARFKDAMNRTAD